MKPDLPASIELHNVIHVSWTRPNVQLPSNLQMDVPIRAEIPEERDHERNAVYKVPEVLAHRRRGGRWH